MSLTDRLRGRTRSGSEPSKLPVHQLCAAIGEVRRGHVTAAKLQEMFGLSQAEAAEIDKLAQSGLGRDEIEDVLMLAEIALPGNPYAEDNALLSRLGINDAESKARER